MIRSYTVMGPYLYVMLQMAHCNMIECEMECPEKEVGVCQSSCDEDEDDEYAYYSKI